MIFIIIRAGDVCRERRRVVVSYWREREGGEQTAEEGVI